MVFGNRVKKEMIQPAGGPVFGFTPETFGRTNDEGRSSNDCILSILFEDITWRFAQIFNFRSSIFDSGVSGLGLGQQIVRLKPLRGSKAAQNKTGIAIAMPVD